MIDSIFIVRVHILGIPKPKNLLFVVNKLNWKIEKTEKERD